MLGFYLVTILIFKVITKHCYQHWKITTIKTQKPKMAKTTDTKDNQIKKTNSNQRAGSLEKLREEAGEVDFFLLLPATGGGRDEQKAPQYEQQQWGKGIE